PEDMFIEKYMFEKMRAAAEKFGYVEYSASILEPAELYRSKTSEEIVNDQTYTFKDRGDREVTLRPEMTPSVARMVADRKRELSFPLRWYSIPNVFRYEQPQRGRLREHWQWNVDIFGDMGDAAAETEAEIISLTHSFFTSLGATEENFEILVSNRKALGELWDKFAIAPEKRAELNRLIDTKEKMSGEKFAAALTEKIDSSESASSIAEALESAESFVEALGEDGESEAMKEIGQLLTLLGEMGIKNARFSPTLARGFDYYTGTVFEIFDTDPKNRRSLAGGGRYDNLLSIFGGDTVPAFGFGLGDVTLRDFLESHNLLPEYTSTAQIFIAVMGGTSVPATTSAANSLATKLRALGASVVLDFSGRTFGDCIKKALKDGVPFFAVMGEDEVNENSITIKNLSEKSEKSFTLDETGIASLAEFLANKN
ncbi:MAG: histidine--tRNA ligase, partial [Patescibacteria group bacterium]